MKKLALLLMLSLPMAGVHALDTPKPGNNDRRVKYVDYNPGDVVKLVAHFGYQINIVFAEGENVLPKGVFLGDGEAWKYATKDNNFFIKPKEENGQTNMTIMTNRRKYTFDLTSHWSKKNRSNNDDMYFQVNFRYPAEEAARALAAAAAQAAKRRLDDTMARTYETVNSNYTVQGSDELVPDEASDDGTFTKLTFRGNRPFPAVYRVNADGSESLVDRTVEGRTLVLHTTAKKLVLRKGDAVACVFNESYDPVGRENTTGTTIPGVVRTIKGEQQ
jgi:type IV secretion system protein VirB9